MAIPGCMRGRHGIIAGINISHASDAPESGLRETGLWISALMLKADAAAAKRDVEHYFAVHDGKMPEKSAEVQRLAQEFQRSYHALKIAIAGETDLDEAAVNSLMLVVT